MSAISSASASRSAQVYQATRQQPVAKVSSGSDPDGDGDNDAGKAESTSSARASSASVDGAGSLIDVAG